LSLHDGQVVATAIASGKEARVPYEYRQLTEMEREEILRQRRERGYPLHSPPHPFRGDAHYLISAANYEHAPIMTVTDRRTEFEAALLDSMHSIAADISGWVILVNHYHLLVAAQSLDDIAAAIRLLHGRTSRAWNVQDGQTGHRRVWYRYSDQVIRDQDHFYRALNYIHVNPVKHGYTGDLYAWPWSSVHSYYESLGREWLRAQWTAHPPGGLGQGWDP
jgi:putative transposase